MSQAAGKLIYRATVQRRAVVADVPGRTRGDFAPVTGLTNLSAGYRQLTLRDHALGNTVQGSVDAECVLRDSDLARTITAQDRMVINGTGFNIVAQGLPDPMTRMLTFQLKKLVG
jgi:head-tail adaptor